MFVLHLSAPAAARGATATPDPVPALLERLAERTWRLPPERTVGPEVLALSARAEEAVAGTLAALELGPWRIGIGIGGVERVETGSVREMIGPAVEAAARAHRDAAAIGQVPLSVRAADVRHEDAAADAQAVLRLVGWMIRTRSRGQWQTVHVLREEPGLTQGQLAERLGVTQQTVSRSLKTSGWREEHAAHGLAERLLAMIDLTSESGRRSARAR